MSSHLRIDITGHRFGKLVAVRHIPGSRLNLAKWLCHCDCGGSKEVHQYSLRKGLTRSCGCLKSEIPAPNKAALIGLKFGRLTVIGEAGQNRAKQVIWRCSCECGGEARTTTTKLKSAHTTSCGCFKNEAIAQRAWKDGLFAGGKRHPLFDSFSGMLGRCTNENDRYFENYGGRGIVVCDRWLNGEGGKTGFALFLKDMGPRPSASHSIDRRDNDGNYEPDNCRWATPTEQARNRRSNRLVDCDGEKVALSEFCERRRLRFEIVNHRIGRGWAFERAISQPVRGGGSLSC